MFGTLKAGKNNAGSMVFVEQGRQSRCLPGGPHNACKTCRDRKLKCTGEATGCKRCKSSNLRCEYRSPTENRRGMKSQRTQGQTAAVGREPFPVAPDGQGQSSPSNEQKCTQQGMSNDFDVNNQNLDMGFFVPSFPASGLADELYDDIPCVDTITFLEDIEENETVDIEDPNFLQQPFEADMLADLNLPPLAVTHCGTSSDTENNFNNSTQPGKNVNSTFIDSFLAPQVQWYHGDVSSPQDSLSISKKDIGSSHAHVSSSSTTSSMPTSSRCPTASPFATTLPEPQPQLKWNSPGLSSESDSDSSSGQCRCSNRALRLLEKLPNVGQSSSSPPSLGGSGESLSPEKMDITFPAEIKPGATNMTKPHFVEAVILFLGQYSHYLAVFSTISQCQRCLRKSSFSMILLILARRLTSRISLLLHKYVHVPARDSRSQKLTLTIAESAIEYDDPLSLVSTLMAGKVCRLATCITRVKSVCFVASWTSYARGFEALEAPLRERMGELEAMM